MMDYNQGSGSDTNWIVTESSFDRKYQGKVEAVFCLGNGYMGLRSATEEAYVGQVRNHFISGTFNKSNANEVTELPNAADVIGMDIYIDGVLFSLENGIVTNYHRSLNLRDGLLVRAFDWETKSGKKLKFEFKRMVSLKDLHVMASQVSITAISEAVEITIKSGINGQMTNSGAQHFEEGEKRLFDDTYLQMVQKTCESGIDFIHNTCHIFESQPIGLKSRCELDRRKIHMVYDMSLDDENTLVMTKISNVYTSRDKDVASLDHPALKQHSLDALMETSKLTFDALHDVSSLAWKELWKRMDIKILGKDPFDQLAIRFALYHLIVMTPSHDNRYGVGAKGLSGEGYKGHSFWDTEIFLLPFFSFTLPEIARSLLEYRHNTLEGAHKKATENGYRGAMYPWESAWAEDGEVTPVWGGIDIVTGKATKIWSGFIEQHITSDIAFAVWQYFMVTKDQVFMEESGYEIIFDTAIFWSSRLEWNEERSEYHINNVVGPDEYKEHVNNDAFTNHMAKWCIQNAIRYYDQLSQSDSESFRRLQAKLNLDKEIHELKERVEQIYVPMPDDHRIIPQDDTYLSKKQIDLTGYKAQEKVGSIFLDYNLDQINDIQVSKQASVVMLLYLLEDMFGPEVKEANYNYYEPKTLHDSSLSLSTHAVLAADLHNMELAYSLFQRASRIDLGPNMASSDHGIHAASLGGIWQIIVCGFGGVRMLDGNLRINPNLPDQIESIEFPINWHGKHIDLKVTRSWIDFTLSENESVELSVQGKEVKVQGHQRIELG